MKNEMNIIEAIRILELSNTNKSITIIDLNTMIIKNFRRLCLKHHPDKGGDATKLNEVVQAKKVCLTHIELVRTSLIKNNYTKLDVSNIGAFFTTILDSEGELVWPDRTHIL